VTSLRVELEHEGPYAIGDRVAGRVFADRGSERVVVALRRDARGGVDDDIQEVTLELDAAQVETEGAPFELEVFDGPQTYAGQALTVGWSIDATALGPGKLTAEHEVVVERRGRWSLQVEGDGFNAHHLRDVASRWFVVVVVALASIWVIATYPDETNMGIGLIISGIFGLAGAFFWIRFRGVRRAQAQIACVSAAIEQHGDDEIVAIVSARPLRKLVFEDTTVALVAMEKGVTPYRRGGERGVTAYDLPVHEDAAKCGPWNLGAREHGELRTNLELLPKKYGCFELEPFEVHWQLVVRADVEGAGLAEQVFQVNAQLIPS